MDEFLHFLLQFGSLNLGYRDTIARKGKRVQLKKGELFWEAGVHCKQVGFIVDGVLRVYYHNGKGEEITSYFIEENHWISDWENADGSFIPIASLQAITDCTLVVFSKQDWKEVCDTLVGLNSIIPKIITKHKSEKLTRRSPLVSEDATERYLSFLENYPNMINRIPLSYVASYLGIKPPSLSRIRKSIR